EVDQQFAEPEPAADVGQQGAETNRSDAECQQSRSSLSCGRVHGRNRTGPGLWVVEENSLMPNIKRRDALKGAAALSSLVMASCSDRDDKSASREMTPLERQYGRGPGKSETSGKNFMEVRSDVHLVEAGPAAVRSVAANGLSWTLDRRITGPIETGR